MRHSVLFCSVLFCSVAAFADDPLPPYRVVIVDIISQDGLVDAGVRWFPRGNLRFQLAGAGDATLIVGNATFLREHDFGSPIGTVEERLCRGRYWHRGEGGWVETPFLSEAGETERKVSVASDINAEAIAVGAVAEASNNTPSSPGWEMHATYWLPDSPSHELHFFDEPDEDCEFADFQSVAYGVGPGAEPHVVGSAYVACHAELPQAFGGWLGGSPSSDAIVPLNDSAFSCVDADTTVVLSEAYAVIPWNDELDLAVGYTFQFDVPGTGLGNCISLTTWCDIESHTHVNAASWWLDEPPVADHIGPVLAEDTADHFRFRARDGQADPGTETTYGWSIAGGTLIDENAPDLCTVHAAVYMGFLENAEEFAQGLTFDVHSAIFDEGDAPDGDGEHLPASAIGAICRAESGYPESPPPYLAAGARMATDSSVPYGVIWLGKFDDVAEEWIWCGRNVNDPEVTWRPDVGFQVLSVQDILPSGIAVGIAAGETVGIYRLVLITSVYDLDGNDLVDAGDLGALLATWGAGPGSGVYATGDLNRDDVTDGWDLGQVMGAWSFYDEQPVPVYTDCAAKLWQPISAIEVETALVLLGFSSTQEFGDYCETLSAEDAIELVRYATYVTSLISHQEEE